MTKICEILLTATIPGLLFCIVPIPGMEFRLSWELASIWLGGVAFTALLSSWWWKGFFLLALVRTAMITPPSYDAYGSLMLIAIFLAAAEGFSRVNPERTMDAMCLAAIFLLLWIAAQKCGWARTWFGADRLAGPFNPDTGGVFLVLCLPACLRDRRWALLPCILWGIAVAGSSTAFFAAAGGVVIFIYTRWLKMNMKKVAAVFVGGLMLFTALWFYKIDSLESIAKCDRWIAWKHAAWSLRSEALGRGLGSWKTIFPLLASGDRRVAIVENKDGTLVISDYFAEAHNEYVQTSFELGMQALLLITMFAGCTSWMILRKPVSAHAAAGIVVLLVACFGWHLFHIAPTALLGCAWLGVWSRESKRGKIIKRTKSWALKMIWWTSYSIWNWAENRRPAGGWS